MRMTIGRKLSGGFVLVLLGALTAGLTGLYAIEKVAHELDRAMGEQLLAVTCLARAVPAMERARLGLVQYLGASTAEERSRHRASVSENTRLADEALSEALAANFARYGASDMDEAFLQIEASWRSFVRTREEELIPAAERGDMELARQLAQGVQRERYELFSGASRALIEGESAEAHARRENALVLVSRVRWLVVVLLAAATAWGVFVAVALSRTLSRGIGAVVERLDQLRGRCVTNLGLGAEALARGDLGYRIITGTPLLEVKGDDEIARLAEGINGIIGQTQSTVAAFERSVESLKALIETDGGAALAAAAGKDLTVRVAGHYAGAYDLMKNNINAVLENLDHSLAQVAEAAGQVATASSEIGRGSQSLAESTSQQASSLEEIAASLQEMGSMTSRNAESARKAKALAESAKAGTDQGVENMRRLSKAIDSIKQSSDGTARILKTIDEIAFQTNLLALNAAVEAARAGAAGAGFAVVADEVRKLAQRSAESARNTAGLIEESVRNAGQGVALNIDVMRSFEAIEEMTRKVREVVAEISSASDQQKLGIDQVNKAVEQLNQTTQANAATSEETAASSEEMSSQAQELAALVTQFRISGGAPSNTLARSHGIPMRARGEDDDSC